MNPNLAQLWTLLRMMVRLDFRSRNPLGGTRSSTGAHALVIALLFYVVIGSTLGVATEVDGFDPVLRMTLLLAITAIYLAFNIIVEYQQILLSPADGDVLYWRPIPSRTLFVARALHIFLYVNLLSGALLLVPSLLIAFSVSGNVLAAWIAFVVAAAGNAILTTAVAILLYTLLLRHISSERLQDALVWFQVVMSLLIFLGYQAIGPLLERMLTKPGSLVWLRFLPARWFASLPEIVGWQASSAAIMTLLGGLLLTFVVVFYAVQRLAPHYQNALSTQESQAGENTYSNSAGAPPSELPASSCSSSTNQGWLQRTFGGFVVRGASERAGYDFFLAMLRGDRRLKTSLLPMAVLPAALLLSGLAEGAFSDPYATAAKSVGSEGGGEDVIALRMSFMAAYLFAFTAVTLTRSLAVSTSWRAAWVFFAAPLARFDRFYRGVVWGATASLLLPTVVSMVVLLQVMWRDPLHVIIHLSVPVGLTFLVLPLTLWFKPVPPFSTEVLRHDRTRTVLMSSLFFLPLTAIAVVHYMLREHGWILLLAGSLLAVAGVFLWWATRHRVHTALHAQSFGG